MERFIVSARKYRPGSFETLIGQENIAKTLGLEKNQVNVKATTEEGLGFTGSGEGISSQAVCMLSSIREWSVMAASSEEGCKSCGGCRG